MATIDPNAVDPIISDGGIGPPTSSRALFIAEILAGAAAAILVVAVICCLCSGAARKRTSQLEREGATLTSVDGHLETGGRQTPDVAPAYSTSSPLGPISPEVVDALSRVSIECRQSFVASILSSNSLQRQLAAEGGGRGGEDSSRISMVSSIAEINDSPRLHHQQLPHSFAAAGAMSAATSPRSSVVSSQYGEIQSVSGGNHYYSHDPFGSAGSEAGTAQEREGGGGGEATTEGERRRATGEGSVASLSTISSSVVSPSNSPSATALLQHLHQHLQQEPPPPSYDPSWRTSLVIPNHDPSYSRRLHWLRNQNTSRSGRGGGGGEVPQAGYRHSSESYSREGYLSPPHRRTGSISAPIVRLRAQDSTSLLQRASTQLRTRAFSNNMDRAPAEHRRHQQQQQQQQSQQSQPQPQSQSQMSPLQRLGSRRSISWTGSPIRFTLTSPAVSNVVAGSGPETPSRTPSTRSAFRALIQRSPLSSSVTAHHTAVAVAAAAASAASASPETWTSDSEETIGTASSFPGQYHHHQQQHSTTSTTTSTTTLLSTASAQQLPSGPPPPIQTVRNSHPRSPVTEQTSRFSTDSTAETRVEMVEPLPDSPLRN